MKKQNKKVVVIGGGGYIGSYVVEYLLAKKYSVVVYDKFIFGKKVLNDFSKDKNLTIIREDISNSFALYESFKDAYAVIHLAGIVGDPACAVDENLTNFTNVAATQIIKELVIYHKISRFIYSSSCSVYGSIKKIATETSTLNPVSLYARTKIQSEKIILQNNPSFLKPTILRLATVFGHSRRPRFDLIANLFTAQAFFNGKISITGVNQSRPFIHVSDAARAFVMILEQPVKKIDSQIFNVGNDKSNMTIAEVANLVKSIVKTDKKNNPVTIIEKIDKSDKRNYSVSFEKINKILDFKTIKTVNDGIQEIYLNLKKNTYGNDFEKDIFYNVKMMKFLI